VAKLPLKKAQALLLRKYRAQYNMGASSYCSGTNQNREAGRKKFIFFTARDHFWIYKV
jgi:hypothetical protein